LEEKMSVVLGELFREIVPVEVGKVRGRCALCNHETDEGLPIHDCVSDRFTLWSALMAGNCFCPGCAYLIRNQDLRRHSWVVSNAGLVFLRRDEVLTVLLEPPQSPFAIHVTTAGKKPTYLRLRFAATARDVFLFSYEGSDYPIFFRHDEAQAYAKLSQEALALGLPREELKEGNFSPSSVRKALGKEELLAKIRQIAPNPLWEVIVHVAPR
jgi:hypothetical protein